MPLLPGKNCQRNCGIFFRCATGKVTFCTALKSEVFRCDGIRFKPTILEFTNMSRRRNTDFIQFVQTIDYHSPSDPQIDQNLCQWLYQIVIIHTQQLYFRAARIRQRPQNIKDGAEPQFPAYRSYIAHGSMVFLGKEEAHTDFIQQLYTFLWALLDVHPQSFQAICRTAHGGCRTIAVFCYLHTAGCTNQCSSSRNIKALRIITTCTDNLKYLHTSLNLCGMIAHSCGTACNLICGLCSGTLGRQCGQKRGILGRARFSGHDLIHHGVCFIVGQVFFADNFHNGTFNHNAFLL